MMINACGGWSLVGVKVGRSNGQKPIGYHNFPMVADM